MIAAPKLRAAPRPAVETDAPKKAPVVIGCRWNRDLHVRVDNRAAGVYEEVNSQLASQTEDYVQRALLAKVNDPASLQRIEAARVARRVHQGTPQ